MKQQRSVMVRALLLLSCFWAETALAWGSHGHVIVCEMAYRMVDEPLRVRLDKLVAAAGHDIPFAHACRLADQPVSIRSAEHYVNFPRSQNEVSRVDCPGGGSCILAAIVADARIIADTRAADAIRGQALILLAHWIADIHQPMHVSYADDRGGGRVSTTGVCGPGNLHGVWDHCLVERRILDRPPANRDDFSSTYRAADRLLDRPLPRVDPTLDPADWAAESYAIVQHPDVDYCHRDHNGCWYRTDSPIWDDDTPTRSVNIDVGYLDRWSPTVERRLQLAAVRLAAMLRTIEPSKDSRP